MQEKQAEWKDTLKKIPMEKFLFLDESGVNINLVRRYGRSVGKTRVVDAALFSTPKNITVLTGIRLDGQFAYTKYKGKTTKERFLDYIENTLLPEIHKGDSVVMDNLRTHHCKGLKELIRSAGQFRCICHPIVPISTPLKRCGLR